MNREGRRDVIVEETRKVKHFVRVDRPVVGFASGGLLPLLLLILLVVYGVTAFARNSVQHVVHDRVRAALDGQGLSSVSVAASGQNVLLRGAPPSSADAERALLLAEQATCPTWFGEHDCTIDVRGAFAAPVRRTSPGSAGLADSCDRRFAQALARSGIEFGTARASVPAGSRLTIAEVATIAAQCPGRIRVHGHTDDRGPDEANLRLSRARAEAVCAAIAAEGVPPERLVAEGFGEARPIAPNDTAAGRARNRRIEIRVVREP